jgi:hypothetical protein
MPMPPITMRSLAAGRSLFPNALDVMMNGTPNAAPEVFKKSRRVGRFFALMSEVSLTNGGN